MSTKVPQSQEDQEIDVFDISKSITVFWDRLNTFTFKFIHFFVRNWIIVLLLIIAGFGIGWCLDVTRKKYDNQIIVASNFGSVDYLYSKIDLLQSKIMSGDTVFLKETVGIKKPKLIKKVEILPIVDAYKFVEEKEENFELIKLIAEDGDINKVLKDNVTSKNYTFHTISFITDELTDNKKIVEPLLMYLNSSEYFNSIQKIGFKNVEQEIAQNDSIISQINSILRGFSNAVKSTAKNDKLVYYNENTQLNDIIKTKQYLVTEQGKNRLKLISFDKTIKEISSVLNVKDAKFVNSNLKLILPILFVFIFGMVYNLKRFYKKQSQKYI
jgi:hypothetical protein